MSSGTASWYGSSCGADCDNSEIASPAFDPILPGNRFGSNASSFTESVRQTNGHCQSMPEAWQNVPPP